jgi:hypothetical protein
VVELGPGGQVAGQPGPELGRPLLGRAGGGQRPAPEDGPLDGADREAVLGGGGRAPVGPPQRRLRLAPVPVQVGQLDLGAGQAVGVLAGHGQGLLDVGQGAVGTAQEPQGKAGPVVAGHGRMLPVGGQVPDVAARLEQGQPLLGVADAPDRRPLVEGRAGQQLVGLHDHAGAAGPQQLLQQRLGAVVAAPELLDGGQAVQHQRQLVGPVQALGQLPGPLVGGLHLRRGEPAGGDQGRAERHPGQQLGLVPVGAPWQPLHRPQQGLQVLDGLAVGAAAQRLLGGRLEVVDRLAVVAAEQELVGQLGHVGRGRPGGPLQPGRHGGVHPGPPGGRDAVVEHRPVEVVGEREPGRHGAVRPVDRPGGPQEAVLAGQGGAAALDLLHRPGPAGRGRGGGELDPGDGGRLEDRQVGGVQPLQLELDQAPQVVGERGLAAVRPAGQLPAAGRRPQDAGVPPGLGELAHEQRNPVGPPVHRPGQLLRDLGPWELALQHLVDRRRVQLAEGELVHPSPQPQVGPGVPDRVAGGQGVGRAVGADQQQPGRGVPGGQPGHQVDGGGVGPVQVL